jgi:hypothetical protein
MLEWRVIYPRGNRNRLDIAQVWSYERDDWALASQMSWENTTEGEQQAREYMEELAERHKLDYPGKQHYLD